MPHNMHTVLPHVLPQRQKWISWQASTTKTEPPVEGATSHQEAERAQQEKPQAVKQWLVKQAMPIGTPTASEACQQA